jgi:hypothetical protein
MAISSAPGYGNLQQGNFIPEIFSQKAQKFYRTAAVVEAITNTDYAGEIADHGDKVRIIKEPVITTQTYVRGKELEIQDLDDQELTMLIDQGIAYAFPLDDVEMAHSHIDWSTLAGGSAGYALTDKFDTEVLQYMHDNATTVTADLGVAGTPKNIGYDAGDDFTPLDFINVAARILDENDVPGEGRWFCASPRFYQELAKEDGKLIDVSVTNDPESLIRSRKFATSKMIHGFTMFKSNNQPLSSSSDVTVLFGHKSAVSTASTISKSEVVRREKTFGNIHRGLLVYGRKVLRAEALFTGFVAF